jgi:hypothetical protein
MPAKETFIAVTAIGSIGNDGPWFPGEQFESDVYQRNGIQNPDHHLERLFRLKALRAANPGELDTAPKPSMSVPNATDVIPAMTATPVNAPQAPASTPPAPPVTSSTAPDTAKDK